MPRLRDDRPIYWLIEHLRHEHPVAAPTLVVSGTVCQVGEAVPIRTSITADSVSTANVTAALLSIDGKPVGPMTPNEIGSRLAAIKTGAVRVQLFNERADGACSCCTIDFRFLIPSADELNAVDDLFARVVGQKITLTSLDDFADGGDDQAGGARPYADGLHSDLRGILQKDGGLIGTHLPYATHRDHLGRALHELVQYPSRPLARAVAGVIRFNLNVFNEVVPSGIPELDACVTDLAAFSRGEASRDPKRTPAEEGGVCPVDDATHTLIQLHRDLVDKTRRRAAVTALLRLAEAPQTISLDHAAGTGPSSTLAGQASLSRRP